MTTLICAKSALSHVSYLGVLIVPKVYEFKERPRDNTAPEAIRFAKTTHVAQLPPAVARKGLNCAIVKVHFSRDVTVWYSEVPHLGKKKTSYVSRSFQATVTSTLRTFFSLEERDNP